jgi:glycosyltransferase involved in cell wall biosynthesis
MPLLSICIATRNRGAFIAETLLSIAPQISEQVEIVVLDGASTDNTQTVVADLQAQIPHLHYFRKDHNGGVDRDYDEAVSLANGEYCWLMSDDDLLKPGAIAAVLTAIAKQPSLIVVNAELCNLDFSRVIDTRRLLLSTDREYRADDLESLFLDTSAYLTYIGAVVINRGLWLERDRTKYYGSYFIHVGVIFQAPLPRGALVLSTPLISIRFGNTVWRPKEFEIRMIRWTELVWSLPLPEGTKRALYPKQPWLSIKSLFFYRAKGTYGPVEYQNWVAPRLTSKKSRAIALFVAYFPGPLANLIGLAYCKQSYRDAEVHFLDMKASRFYYRNWRFMVRHR